MSGAPACNEAPGRRRRRARVRRGARVHARYTRLPDGQVPGRGSSTRCQFLKVPRKFAARQDDRTQQHKISEMQVSNCRLRPTTSNALSKVEKSTGVHTRPRREYSGLPTSNCETLAGARALGRPGRRATGFSPNRLHVLTLQGAPAPLRLPAPHAPAGAARYACSVENPRGPARTRSPGSASAAPRPRAQRARPAAAHAGQECAKTDLQPSYYGAPYARAAGLRMRARDGRQRTRAPGRAPRLERARARAQGLGRRELRAGLPQRAPARRRLPHGRIGAGLVVVHLPRVLAPVLRPVVCARHGAALRVRTPSSARLPRQLS